MSDTKTVALESFRLIENGDVELAEKIIASDFVNQEADDDPEEVERQQHGAAGFLATSQWLRNAFSNLSFEHQETLAEGEHTGIFNGIQPTGKHIEHKQVHIFTITDGQITHHRAIRDDLGLLLQLGWRPGGVA